MGSTAHSAHSTPSQSITNQENASKVFPQLDFMESLTPLRF